MKNEWCYIKDKKWEIKYSRKRCKSNKKGKRYIEVGLPQPGFSLNERWNKKIKIER